MPQVIKSEFRIKVRKVDFEDNNFAVLSPRALRPGSNAPLDFDPWVRTLPALLRSSKETSHQSPARFHTLERIDRENRPDSLMLSCFRDNRALCFSVKKEKKVFNTRSRAAITPLSFPAVIDETDEQAMQPSYTISNIHLKQGDPLSGSG